MLARKHKVPYLPIHANITVPKDCFRQLRIFWENDKFFYFLDNLGSPFSRMEAGSRYSLTQVRGQLWSWTETWVEMFFSFRKDWNWWRKTWEQLTFAVPRTVLRYRPGMVQYLVINFHFGRGGGICCHERRRKPKGQRYYKKEIDLSIFMQEWGLMVSIEIWNSNGFLKSC